MSAVLKGFIRKGRVEVDVPIDLPDGTEVVVAAESPGADEGPVTPEEIARTLAGRSGLRTLDIPDAVSVETESPWPLNGITKQPPAHRGTPRL